MKGMLRDLVMILPISEGMGQTESGITVVTHDKGPKKGVVVAVGPGKMVKGKFVPTTVKPGDQIVYVLNNLQEVKVKGDVLHVVPETEVLATLAP